MKRIFCLSLLLLSLGIACANSWFYPTTGVAWGGFCNDSIVGATTLGANFYDISNIAGGTGAVTVVSGKISQITDACTPGAGDTLSNSTPSKRFTYNAIGFAAAYPAATESSASDFLSFASTITGNASYTVVWIGSSNFVTWNLFTITGGPSGTFLLGSTGSNFVITDNQSPTSTSASWTSSTSNSPVMVTFVISPVCTGGLVYLNNAVSEGAPTCTGSTLQLADMTITEVGKSGLPATVTWAELMIYPNQTFTSSMVSRLYTHFSSAFGGAF